MSIPIASNEPVRVLAALAALAEVATRYVHNPIALAALPLVVGVAELVRRIVTPDAHVEDLTPEQWLQMPLDHRAVVNAQPAGASSPTLPPAPPSGSTPA